MFAERRQLLFMETSALLAENINKAFELLVESMYDEDGFNPSCL